MACHGSFLSCCEENDPDHKSGWDLDTDKPVCSTSCREYVTDPSFSCTFLWFSSLIPQFLQPTLESVTGSVPVEHSHKH